MTRIEQEMYLENPNKPTYGLKMQQTRFKMNHPVVTEPSMKEYPSEREVSSLQTDEDLFES